MKPKILITDSLFIFEEHEKRLRDAGFEVERLDKPKASEEELIKAVKDKDGYILGGIEKVTEPVINAANKLKGIVFSGSDWAGFVPAHELATKKGIAIANAPGANSTSVAEYTITLIFMMLRRALELGSTGDKTFMTTQSVSDVKIGIVGLGRIGTKVAKMLKGLGAKDICYWNRTRKQDLEKELGIKWLSLEELFKTSDVITAHVSSQAGQVFTKDLLNKSKDGVLFINTGADPTYDMDALYELLKAGKARAGFDENIKDERFKKLPLSVWFCSNENTAYNTHAANKLGSDMATETMINILTKGDDQYVVNPDFKKARK
ncbi:hypothetical protein A3G67_00240 [Candidatus Roizmanbacteria bacterium RIFCSPLOWO2_12_FULL_40_12]|uniref:Lactate dehydrogenase n=1 Tax=Candidatus Roizmanbacteria bacterium RIFCSPLOWO2_01_FULL_40_42 TaxID=1802066 RepID=A0A1F7J581_9BACT|nr:MAG: hypothetical protein A2779_01660 [Candidatus Roizmanbacteria bacterium RIFCSPHIGHO2_01_FULL_40_98]OGK28692.1 MAG: hypothetical protein A3C31_02910 [Candidatus Roizmanbacteria bacterium RIFCSPHIGHO2_02_FULL_40_53]OGK29518.1 MAG: hypothetical protein A2W49_04980 [Candidatus Roizmanbacteria bacterium RIFCSPHIGHO2_12_41_18]OGK36812.1 MAG: hypothetical protein A3E69_03965 [Candidatus Roizmanbacteria bacterium RIFCSPHIGHO2_12_FULL_40_130]OGK50775.1 MAG: hypothetical protein A3B50_02915 [Candi